MADIVPFSNGEYSIRTLVIDGEPWFVAKDVCDVLELSNTTEAIRNLDDDEKQQVSLALSIPEGGNTSTNVINEPGLYSLVLRSRKPEAKAFKRWVTHEVLPALRKTGTYTVPGREKPESVRLRQYVEAAARRTERELAKRGIIGYVNRETGELTILPGTIAAEAVKQQVEAWTEQYAQMRQRQAGRSADSPHETRAELERNKPWQQDWGQR